MKNQIKITYCGMEGNGRTVTEAKKDAAKKLEQAVSGSYEPILLSCRKYAVLVYRDYTGWDFCTLADERGFRTDLCTGSLHNKAKEFVLEMARTHLAQLAWVPEDGLNPPEMLILDHPGSLAFRSWAEFQLRYRDAIRMGMSTNDAHDYAGRNPARPEIWSTTEVNS